LQKALDEKYLQNIDEVDRYWIGLLCKWGNREEFNKIVQHNINIPLAIMEYRENLRDNGRGNVSFLELNTAYINKQFKKLHKLFEVMFLEFIPNDHFDYILNKINNTENGLQKLYNIHLEDKGTRILSIALVL
jgi:hypothetical protein